MSTHKVDHTVESFMSFTAHEIGSGVVVKPLSDILSPFSPTSVAETDDYVLPRIGEQSSIRPKVIMSDDGAEITLETNDSSFQRISAEMISDFRGVAITEKHDSLEDVLLTPAKKRRSVLTSIPTSSLLDSENTPSPSPPQPYRPLSACCGSTHQCYTEITITERDVERTISGFLANSNALDDWCGSWQAWSYYEMDQLHTDRTIPLKTHVKKVLRNRAGDLHAKSKRLAKLRQDPFATPKKAERLTKTTSYCVSSKHQSEPPSEEKSTFTSIMTACAQPSNNSPFIIRTRDLDEDNLCYDSDPEEATRKRSSSEKENRLCGRKYHVRDSFVNPMIDLSNDNEVQQRIREVMNKRYKLLWHSETSPTPVTCYLERGQQLANGKLLHPKLVFMLSEGKNNRVYATDLLDITRVLNVNRIDRRRYPFAQRSKCLIVQTLDRKLMLECKREEDRQWFLHDLKLVVARLASKIIMDDEEVFDEFFVNDCHGVPGKAPRWAQGENGGSSALGSNMGRVAEDSTRMSKDRL